MNWKTKMMIRHSLLALPGGVGLYQWLTRDLLGLQGGMAAKWFRVFPAHIKVLQEHFGADARAQRLWCFDCGSTIGAGLAMALVTDSSGLLTNHRNRLADRYNDFSRTVLQDKGAALAELSGAPPERIAELLRQAAGDSALAALAAIKMSYADTHQCAGAGDWQGSVGCTFSADALEHYTPEELEVEAGNMARALRKGGVISHVVDHRDHLWHADKERGPLHHLTMDDSAYQRQFGNPLDYHNRWLRSSYVDLFTRHGFTVTCRDVINYTPDLPPLIQSTLAPAYRGANEEDLRSLVTHFIAVNVGF